jgi:5-hydroxyisourate hydrolase-like protein (transthyretin family)
MIVYQNLKSEVLSLVRLLLCVVALVVPVTMLKAAPQPQGRNPNAAEAIPLLVSPYGFAQTNISLQAGAYVFVVLNRTGFDDITVYLERMPGNNITDNPSQQEFGDSVGASRARLVKSTKLTPGTYRLRVDKRPAWVCAIRVN